MCLAVIHVVIYSSVSIFVLTSVGNWLCRSLIKYIGLKDSNGTLSSSHPNVGRYIGGMERTIIALGLIVHSWEAVAVVIALKTIARFKELDKKLSAEYFLVGSMFSILWAIFACALWLAYDRHFGLNVSKDLVALIGKQGS